MTTGRWITLIVVLLGVMVAVMFTVQNSSRLADLSLNLGFAAWHLKAPAPLPYMLWSAFGLGLVGGGLWGVAGKMAAQRRVRELETELARASLGTGHDDWT